MSDRTVGRSAVSPAALRSLLDQMVATGDLPRTVALAPRGGWVVVGADRFWSDGVPSECHQILRNLYAAPTGVPIDTVAFVPGICRLSRLAGWLDGRRGAIRVRP